MSPAVAPPREPPGAAVGPARTTARAGRRVRPAVLLAVGLVLLALAVVASLALGARLVPWSTLWDGWLHHDAADPEHAVVRSRLPRTVVGLAVGAALGLAGAALQGLARNPLADPGVLGINAGA